MPNAAYATGARSSARLKYKRFDDAGFEIISGTSANGTDAGCVVWRCATESGRIFEVAHVWFDNEGYCAFVNAE